ncbi:YqzE family protein [Virgibacillus halophilus]|uniref:YqzE family protein n=1 Tax=Tigheibacillus halophilus TaxID=361280 RepID=A0ABU5CCD8_9BACI|nr:YqzE family protein [Virgibacillus halophilus]
MVRISGNDYIKFITQQVVSYMDSPKEERIKRKTKNRNKAGVSSRWFGVLPLAIRLFMKKSG